MLVLRDIGGAEVVTLCLCILISIFICICTCTCICISIIFSQYRLAQWAADGAAAVVTQEITLPPFQPPLYIIGIIIIPLYIMDGVWNKDQ